MLEYLESLLTGTGHDLDLRTFKLVDQLSGRTLGLRADTTPQVARIDAHLLNRPGVVRLCYCGPVVHTRPAGPWSSREPLQFGAELYGHLGLEADLEVLELALDGLRQAGVKDAVLDLGDARIANALVQALGLDTEARPPLLAALSAKDGGAMAEALAVLQPTGKALQASAAAGIKRLLGLYGPVSVLDRAAEELPALPPITQALADLRRIVRHVQATHPDVRIGVDLADLGGQDYYSGIRFSVMGLSASQVLASGGRYDHVGRVFGRERPAVGFSLDLKALSQALQAGAPAPVPR